MCMYLREKHDYKCNNNNGIYFKNIHLKKKCSFNYLYREETTSTLIYLLLYRNKMICQR